jgi:alpha-L-fucosidase
MQEWFTAARFGMFIHWGASSQRGWELSWPLVGGIGPLPQAQAVSVDEYHSTAATFNPVKFNPREWARLAKRAGMQYAVLTSKHHDGFAMFHSRHTSYTIEHTPFRRDIVREYVEAFRAEGIRVGLYFSLIDWHDPDYPAFAESDKPYRWGQWRRGTDAQWTRFCSSMFGQIRELLTSYGRIDLLWFDGGWERSAQEWQARELEKMIRELQPGIVINDRLPGCGDYDTPEQGVPARVPARAWETCMTMNNSWGYNPSDRHYESVRSLINTLSEVAAKGGRLLLNVGPKGDGSLAAEQADGSRRSRSGWSAAVRASLEPSPDSSPGSSTVPQPGTAIASICICSHAPTTRFRSAASTCARSERPACSHRASSSGSRDAESSLK